ncbi:DUF7845 domain-containing protein [Haloarchaeobius iranensis]|uniref:DUF7845 domain-containing protein n=1 Tax=Haloarchaeobius iranensis TaxID=996166 RepID=A0A1G9XY13_9EURY|nr:hypothetical protein [Haloarchaeobius iranensis]SDN01669.1 hypothetical protein SAMN05192554_11238 [Haloarchaeobius iranensis]
MTGQTVTQPHEFEAYLKYPQYGLGPYQLLAKAIVGRFDGYAEFETEIDGERWEIQCNYSKTGIAPRPSDNIAGEALYSWDITCKGEGRRKFSPIIEPRFQNMRHRESGDELGFGKRWWTRFGTEGVDVELKASNVEPEEVPKLLHGIFDAVATHAGLSMNSRYFTDQPSPAHSRVTAYERYVRVRREIASKLLASGTMMKAMHLLADEKGTKAEYKVNNEEIVGYMHRLWVDPESAQKLIPSHRYGFQFKHYHPKHVKSDPENPLYHPKIGVLINQERNGGDPIVWRDLEDAEREIEETLLNFLDWGSVPTDPDPGTYVEDDHFRPAAREETVAMYDDPTPQIEAEQEHLLVTSLRDMTDADLDVLDQLLTDGGGQHYEEIAEETGRGVSTIYRALKRLGAVLENDDGVVSFASRKFHDELKGIIESTEHQVKNAADRAAKILGMNRCQAESSAFQLWLNKYGAEVTVNDDGSVETVRIETMLSKLKATAKPRIQDVLAEGRKAWHKSGYDVIDLAGAEVVAKIDGERERGVFAALAR